MCEPSSELHIAEDWYRRTALSDLLQLDEAQVNKDRLYRALDELLVHKAALEAFDGVRRMTLPMKDSPAAKAMSVGRLKGDRGLFR